MTGCGRYSTVNKYSKDNFMFISVADDQFKKFLYSIVRNNNHKLASHCQMNVRNVICTPTVPIINIGFGECVCFLLSWSEAYSKRINLN